jgi:hypothetical protein
MKVAEIKRKKEKIRLPLLQQKMQRLISSYPKLTGYRIQYCSWGLEDM